MARRPRPKDEAILRDLTPDASITIVDMEGTFFSGQDTLRTDREQLLKMRAVYPVDAIARVISENRKLQDRFQMRGNKESNQRILRRAIGVTKKGRFCHPLIGVTKIPN
jgi:hypothetical protein